LYFQAKDFFKKIFGLEIQVKNLVFSYPSINKWLNDISTPLQDDILTTVLDNDKDGRLLCWLLLEAENLTEKQKNRIIGNIIEKDIENQYLPFVHYILGISKEELETRIEEQKITDNPEELINMDR